MAGSRTSLIDQNAAGVLLFNPDLTLKFNRRFSSSGTLDSSGVAPTPDGGYVVAGTISLPSGDSDAIVFKLGATGNILWKKIFGTPDIDQLHYVTVLQDGSIAVLGHRITASNSLDLLISTSFQGGRIVVEKGSWNSSNRSRWIHYLRKRTRNNGLCWNRRHADFTVMDQIEFERCCAERARWIHTGSNRNFLHGESEWRVLPRKRRMPLVHGELQKTNISRFDASDRLVWAKSYGFPGNMLTTPYGFVNADGSMVLAGNSSTPSTPSILRGVVMKISSFRGNSVETPDECCAFLLHRRSTADKWERICCRMHRRERSKRCRSHEPSAFWQYWRMQQHDFCADFCGGSIIVDQ